MVRPGNTIRLAIARADENGDCNNSAVGGFSLATKRVPKIGDAIAWNAELTDHELTGGACVECGGDIGRPAGQAIIATDLRQKYRHVRDACHDLCPRNQISCEVSVAMKGHKHAFGMIAITDEVREEFSAIFSAVRDLPRRLADSARRKHPAQHERWLKYDALLLHPQKAEEQQVQGNGGEHGKQEQHVARDVVGRRRCAGFLRTGEECNLRGCVFQSKPFACQTVCS